MPSPETVAIFSAFFAGAAAFIAWLTWTEAKRSNRLSLHERRLEVYRAIQDLRFIMQSEGLGVQTSQVVKFLRVISEAKFCFKNKETYQAIHAYFENCLELADLNRKNSRSNIETPERAILEKYQDSALDSDQALYRSAIELLEKELYASL